MNYISIMTDCVPMKTGYGDTVNFDWSTHFQRQADSGLNDLLATIDQSIYQHKRLKYIVVLNKGGSLNTDIMMEYVTRIVASDTPRHLLLDTASINKMLH